MVLQQRSKLEHCFLLAEILWNVRAASGVSVVWCWSLLSGTFTCLSSWWLFGSYSESKWVRPWCKLIHCLGHFQDSGYCCLHLLFWSLGKNIPRFLLGRPSCCLQYLGIRDCTYSQLSPAGCQGTGALSDSSECQNTSFVSSLGSRWVSERPSLTNCYLTGKASVNTSGDHSGANALWPGEVCSQSHQISRLSSAQ